MTYVGLAAMVLTVATISRTVTQEAIFAGLQEWARSAKTRIGKKIFYPLTCQYCFSHWVTTAMLLVVGQYLPVTEDSLFNFFLTLFAVVALANTLMITYEAATVRVKLNRAEIVDYDARTALSFATLESVRMQNTAMQIQVEGLQRIKSFADEQNAKVEAEAAKTQFGTGNFIGGN